MKDHPMWGLIEQLEKLRGEALSPGSDADRQRHQARGKLLARERVELLVDRGTFRELDLLVFPESAEEALAGKARPGDGVITGWGNVDGRRVFVFSQDATVVGGSLGGAGGEKVAKLMDLAGEAGAPIVGINDGGGARIQEGVVSLAAYGGVFARNVRYSGVVPQISVIMGVATGGAVYSPALTDFVFMVDGTAAMSITGPDVVRAATGEVVSFDELGGAAVHATRSGVAHFVAPDELSCLAEVRRLLSYLPSSWQAPPPAARAAAGSADVDDLVEFLPPDSAASYDIRSLISAIVDAGEFMEYSAAFAPNIVCGYARLGGRAIGVVANQPSVMSGILNIDACEKAARFVRTCDAFGLPLVVLVDSPGFQPGVDQEYSGLARRAAKLLYAFAEATVPTIQLVVRRAYGAAYVVMAAKATGTHLAYAWPSAELAVMGASAAVQLLHRADIGAADDPEAVRDALVDRYLAEVVNPYRAAARGYLDDVIDPRTTRDTLIEGLELLANTTRPEASRKHGNVPL